MNNFISVFLISLSSLTGEQFGLPVSDCEKCNGTVLLNTEQNLDKLSLNDIHAFYCTFDSTCEVNVEFSEYSNELLFKVLTVQPELSIEILQRISESSLNAILRALESPINDSIDVRDVYAKIEKVKDDQGIRSQVLKSLQIAISK